MSITESPNPPIRMLASNRFRRHNRYTTSWLLLVLLLVWDNTTAWAGNAKDAYRAGNEAFRAGAYEQALEAYLQARQAGIKKNALIYNLAVTYYKLGRYEEAGRHFRELLADPQMAALAAYNLGLVAVRRDRKKEARQWFERTLTLDAKPALQTAARDMLDRLKPAGPTRKTAPASKKPKASGFILLGTGYDDNVTLSSGSETIATAEQRDGFAELLLYGRARVQGDRRRGTSLESSLYLINYEELNAYNISALRFGGLLNRRTGAWRWDTGLHYIHTLLDQEGYTRSFAASFKGRRKLDRQRRLQMRYELAYIDDLDQRVAYLQGWRHKLSTGLRWRQGKRRLSLSYQLELNDRQDLNGTRFVSYSPTRHTLRLRGQYAITPRYSTTLKLRYRYSRYNDPSELIGGGTRRREEQRTLASWSLSRTFSQGKVLSAELRYTWNDSNFTRYDYERGQILVNFLWPW